LTYAALTWLQTNQQTVNALNVFPVPDGDTGTNMLLTMQSAYKEVAESHENNVGKMAQAIAHGALMGARGNSGVILSQIWRGFARALDSVEVFDVALFAKAVHSARNTAYRGVVKPVEGTILTVIKDCASAADGWHTQTHDLVTLLEHVVTAAHGSVQRTPELLPVLKQAGVVDSGGFGLTLVLEGMLRYMRNLPLDRAEAQPHSPLNLAAVGAALDAVEPGQEWEVVVDFRPRAELNLQHLYTRLEQLGTSIQVGEGEGLYRVHVHLLKVKRHEPIELAEELGTVIKVHMENLLDQLEGVTAHAAEAPLSLTQVQPGQIGVVAVSPGKGLARVMASLGAAAIVSGGQTMNPSTNDLLEAIGNLPTDHIIILPNNKNVILAAQQAAELSVKNVAVVPSRTVPQGIAALLNYVPEGDLETVRGAMERALSNIETGEVTTATRTVEIDGVAVEAGQVIGLHNGSLKIAGQTVPEVVLRLLELMDAPQRELVTLYRGEETPPAAADQLVDQLATAYPNLTIEVHDGGQPYYHYILSAE
jgi:hypothetical protein